MGRRTISEKEKATVLSMYKSGASLTAIKERTGMAIKTISRILEAAGIVVETRRFA